MGHLVARYQSTQPKNAPLHGDDFFLMADYIPHIVWITDHKGKNIYLNKRWYVFSGLDPKTATSKDQQEVIHPDDRKVANAKWAHSIKSGSPLEFECRFRSATGEYCWFLVRANPFLNSKNKIQYWIGTSTDITDQKRIIEKQQFLASASSILNSSLDYNKTLESVTQLAIAQIADWCSVDILDEEGFPQLVAVAHRDAKKISWAKELRKQSPIDMSAKSGMPEVLRSGKAELYSFITDEMLVAAAKSKEELELLRSLEFESIMIIPIIIGKKCVGVIQFVSTNPSNHYTQEDVSMAQELANRAALAIQNAHLYQELEEKNIQFRSLYDANIIGVLFCNLNGVIFDANDAFLSMIGYTRAELKKGKINWNTLTPDEYRIEDEKAIVQLLTTGTATPWEKEYMRRDGSPIPVIVGASLLNRQTTETIAFVLDITERKKLEQRKDEFIGIASHELKTPLTSIKGYTQILERIIHQMGDKRLEGYLERTNNYIDRLNSLITDLLDVSKIQAGKLVMNFTTFDVKDLIADAIDNMQHISEYHKIINNVKLSQELEGDRHRLEQVLINLISNAIKYSPKAPKITVSAKRENGSVVISVTDTGIGIPKEKQQRLFERFYRVDDTAKHFSGLGIGLYISSEIINRHGGRIWLNSTPGKGSTFYFTLPIQQPKQ